LKIDKYVKALWDKADNLAKTNEIIAATTAVYDDDYCIATGSTPIRFKAYRRARWEKLGDWGLLKDCEDVDKTITQDELDFGLKRYLSMPPEERYQTHKDNRFFHELGSYMRGLSIDDWDKGCHDEECIPECPFYPEYGRIEDAEVIEEHNQHVEKLRRENRIVEPPSESEMVRILKELKHLF
jgi:hypothetical protein